MPTTFEGFPKGTLKFLRDLHANNTRPWFAENKSRYEQYFLQPSLDLITALEKPLAKVAPCLTVEAKKMGGSLMRIYKDTRFSNDKTPYKTNIGIQFRHQSGKDVHAPGIYFHVANDECFVGAGIWKPEAEPLKKIREYIDTNQQSWKKASQNKRFRDAYDLFDDRLKGAPRGYDKEHPFLDDLRRRSFIGGAPLTAVQIQSPELVGLIVDRVQVAKPFMAALCEALELPY
jgi:uncharacterized protein (TIGR02453 family)